MSTAVLKTQKFFTISVTRWLDYLLKIWLFTIMKNGPMANFNAKVSSNFAEYKINTQNFFQDF